VDARIYTKVMYIQNLDAYVVVSSNLIRRLTQTTLLKISIRDPCCCR